MLLLTSDIFLRILTVLRVLIQLERGDCLILIDYGDKRPIYEQVVERFQSLILGGILEPDTQLPSVRQLATELALNPNTIQRAYAELERSGYIYSVKGRGNFVREVEALRDKKRESLLENVRSSVKECQKAGISKAELEKVIQTIYEEEDL